MKNIAVIVNSKKESCLEFAKHAKNIIEKCDAKCLAVILTSEDSEQNYIHVDPSLIPAGCQAVIVLGGDGTLLHASKDLIDLNLPLLGINFGTLGFLTEIEPDDFESAVRKIAADDFQLECRMLIKGSVVRDGTVIKEDIALNDIVLTRSGFDVMTFDVYVNGGFLNTYSADGMILSTPTGSTGYNLSSGGPVVLPTAEIIIATPMSAHTLNSRSIAFPANAYIDMLVKERHGVVPSGAVLFDGENVSEIRPKDVLRISKSDRIVRIIKINRSSFIENLGRKMR